MRAQLWLCSVKWGRSFQGTRVWPWAVYGLFLSYCLRVILISSRFLKSHREWLKPILLIFQTYKLQSIFVVGSGQLTLNIVPSSLCRKHCKPLVVDLEAGDIGECWYFRLSWWCNIVAIGFPVAAGFPVPSYTLYFMCWMMANYAQ